LVISGFCSGQEGDLSFFFSDLHETENMLNVHVTQFYNADVPSWQLYKLVEEALAVFEVPKEIQMFFLSVNIAKYEGSFFPSWIINQFFSLMEF
jgi:hypothetical protein